jgi:hypothetical protein
LGFGDKTGVINGLALANPLKDFEEAKFASKSHGLITSYSANTH